MTAQPLDAGGPVTVAVYGGCRTAPHATTAAAAAAGRLLARRGLHLVYGGGTTGPAGACAQAAAAAGGTVTAITLAHWVEPVEPAQQLLVSADLASRTVGLDRRADAVLVLPGGLGTWTELMLAWTGRVNGLHTRPIVVLDPDRVLNGLWLTVHEFVLAGAVPAGALSALDVVTDPAAAVDKLDAVAHRRSPG